MIPIEELLDRFKTTKKKLMEVRMDLFLFSEFPNLSPPQFEFNNNENIHLNRIINSIDVVIEDLDMLIKNLQKRGNDE